jgi:hypothetical protein
MTSRSPAKRRTIATAEALIAAACLSLATGAAQAQTSRDCLYVDSRQGWQALPAPAGAVVDLAADGEWTVWDGTQPPVNLKGHVGAAADELAPWTGYKYDQSYPFGAMLYRGANGKVGSFADLATRLWLGQATGREIDAIGAIELRINDGDNALDDNAGRIRVCLIYQPPG